MGAATSALAQSGPDMDFSGQVSFAYSHVGSGAGSDTGLVILELEAETRFGPASPFGLFLSYDGIVDIDDTDTIRDAGFIGLTYNMPNGQIQLGRVNSGVAEYLDRDQLGMPYEFGEFLQTIAGSPLTLSVFSDEPSWGLRYIGDYGAFDVDVSYHRIKDEIDFVSLLMGYDVQNYRFHLGYETAFDDIPAGGDPVIHLGVDADFGRWQASAIYTANPLFTSNREALRLYGVYEVTDRLDVGLSHTIMWSGGSPDTLTGIGARYDFTPDLYIKADVMDGSGSTDTAIGLEVGYTF